MRRSASVSSAGSRDSGGGLKRSPSAGSMSERSLRSASPRRPPVHNSAEEPPPVPSIPDHAVPRTNGDGRNGNKRRAVSLNVQPLKLGSDMMKEGHTSWFGPPTIDPAARMRTSDAILHNSDARPRSSGSSINFSYPGRARVASPTTDNPPTDKPTSRHAPTRPSTAGSAQEMVYDPNSRRMVPRSEVLERGQSMKEPPRRPTRRRRKKRASAPASDTGAGMGSKPEEAVAEPEKPAEALAPFEAPELVTGRMYEDMGAEIFVEPSSGPNEGQPSGSGPEVHVPAIPDTHHEGAGATLFPSRRVSDQPRYEAYRPPTAPVHEIAEGPNNHRHASSAQGAAPERVSVHTDNHPPVELPADRLQEDPRTEPPTQLRAEGGKAVAQDPKGAPAGHHKTVSIARNEKLPVPMRHSPPPRSTSPIKSALKHPFGSDHGSEASTDVAQQHMDPAAARKKSVRVSFDDESTVVAEATPDNNTSAGSRAGAKKRWFNLSRRRGSGTSTGDGEDDEVMKPRPMLPSFGSIREKKAKENEERPLVRPPAFANSPPRSTPPGALPTIPSVPDLGGHGEGVSSDHAIGTALTDDLAHRHEENASGLREPLPPQVTSVEGDGFWSDESSGDSLLSSDDEGQPEPTGVVGSDEADGTPASTVPGSDATRVEAGAINAEEKGHGDPTGSESKPEPNTESSVPSVPQISVSDPSLRPKEEVDMPDSPHSSESEQFFDVPGTFPDYDGTNNGASASDLGGSQADTPQDKATTSQMPRETPPRDFPATIEEESEESGVFSDAYEDLSDVDGDGFQSLDAIAHRPARSEASEKPSSKAVASFAEEIGEGKATTTSGPSQVDGARDMDWEQAKAYWRSLSADKRRQLEREAMQEAGEEADLDESRPTAKPKKKKSGKTGQNNLGDGQASPTGPPAQGANGRRFLRKTLRGSRPGSSDGAAVAQSQPERQGMLKSLRSPPPVAPSEVASEGGMRKSLRTQHPPDTAAEGHHSKEKRHALQLPTSSMGLAQKLKARPDRRAVSLEENPRDAAPLGWPASPPRRGSYSSESSFQRATPRREPSGFRKTLRSASDSPGMVPGSNAGKMGSFSLRSSSPPRGPLRRMSLGSSPSASPASRVRTSLRGESSEGAPRHRRIFSLGRFSRKGGKERAVDDDSSDEDVFAEPSSSTDRRPVTASGAAPFRATPAAAAAPADEPTQVESEELSDSDSDAETNHPPATAPRKQTALGTSLLTNGSAPPMRSGRGSHPKPKAGLMSALRRRKADQGRIARPERMESAARRDTRLERSAAELEALRGDEGDDGESIEVPRRLEKRAGEGLEGKRRFSALRRVFKMDG